MSDRIVRFLLITTVLLMKKYTRIHKNTQKNIYNLIQLGIEKNMPLICFTGAKAQSVST